MAIDKSMQEYLSKPQYDFYPSEVSLDLSEDAEQPMRHEQRLLLKKDIAEAVYLVSERNCSGIAEFIVELCKALNFS